MCSGWVGDPLAFGQGCVSTRLSPSCYQGCSPISSGHLRCQCEQLKCVQALPLGLQHSGLLLRGLSHHPTCQAWNLVFLVFLLWNLHPARPAQQHWKSLEALAFSTNHGTLLTQDCGPTPYAQVSLLGLASVHRIPRLEHSDLT